MTGSSENSDIVDAMCMAEWMLSTGKTSDDWYNLPVRDVKLLTNFIMAKRKGVKADIAEAVGGVLSGGKKR